MVVAVLAGLGLATVGFVRANTRLPSAATEGRADDNFREARAALRTCCKVCDERLRDRLGLQPLRIELMKAVIDRYEGFLAQPIADPDSAHGTGEALMRSTGLQRGMNRRLIRMPSHRASWLTLRKPASFRSNCCWNIRAIELSGPTWVGR